MGLRNALALLCLSCACLSAQRTQDDNAHTWWVYYGEHPLASSRWSLLSEVQVRRADFGAAWQQLLLRDGVLYNFSPHVQAGGGYGYINTSRYGGHPVAKAFKEHRLFGQLVLKHQAGKVALEHRYRFEKRWLETPQNWRPQNRFRYQLRAVIPVSAKWYVFAGDELFIGLGANHGADHFDQNRAFAGVGYKVTRNNRLEIGYLNQYLVQRTGLVAESNHTLRLQLTSFSKLFGSK